MATMLRAEKILVPARVAFGNLLGCMADPWLLTDPSATGVLAAVLSNGTVGVQRMRASHRAHAGGVMVDKHASENEAVREQVSDFIVGTNPQLAMPSMVAIV
jgi:hypothetical protein